MSEHTDENGGYTGPLDRWVARHAHVIEYGGRNGYWLSDEDISAFQDWWTRTVPSSDPAQGDDLMTPPTTRTMVLERLETAFRSSTRHPRHLAFLVEPIVLDLIAEAWNQGYAWAMDDDPRALANNPYRPLLGDPEDSCCACGTIAAEVCHHASSPGVAE